MPATERLAAACWRPGLSVASTSGRRIATPGLSSLGFSARLVSAAGIDEIRGSRTDVQALSGSQIEPAETALLRLGVDDVEVLGIDPALKSVAAADVVPVAGANAGAVQRS